MIPRIFLTIFVAIIGVGAVSVVWPRITKVARPAPLQKMYDAIVSTDAGRQAASVLGASTTEASGSASLGTVAGNIVSSIGSTIMQRVEQSVTDQAISQITAKFDTLPEKQKAKIQEAICQPTKEQP